MTTNAHDATDSDYWTTRGIEPPSAVDRPNSVRALRRRIAAASEHRRSTLIVGSGSHLRPPAITAEPFDLVVTTGCDRIHSIDRLSGTVTVEAGVRWGELQNRLRDEQLPFAPKGLCAANATIGGLLSSGLASEIGPDVAAMTACTASGRDYRYAEAPRKAAGPDLRHLFMGCEGAFGVILTVTLALGPRPDARLWRVTANRLKGEDHWGSALIERLADGDVRIAWSWLDETEGVFDMAVHGPTQLLERWRMVVDDALASDLDLEVRGADACRRRRVAIESEELPHEHGRERIASTPSGQPEWLRHIKRSLDGAGSLATGPRPGGET